MTLVGGMVLGSALTMLFTPQSGPELRRQIKDMLDREVDRVKEKVAEVADQLESTRCHCHDEN